MKLESNIHNGYRLLLLIVINFLFFSCSVFKNSLESKSFVGIAKDATYIIHLEKYGKGTGSKITNDYSIKDTFDWKKKAGVLYIRNFNSINQEDKKKENAIIPNFGLVRCGHLYFKNDSIELLLYNEKIADFDVLYKRFYHLRLQESGFKGKLIKRCFGDSLKIQKKLRKAKPLNIIFQD